MALKSVVDEFKAFILRGNVLDLAVAVILGVAFGTVVSTFTNGILMNLIGAIFGKPSFDAVTLDVGDGTLLIGTFLTAVVNFLLIALALFFVIKVLSRLVLRKPEPEEEAPVPTDEALLLGEIRDLLRVATSSRRSATPPTP